MTFPPAVVAAFPVTFTGPTLSSSSRRHDGPSSSHREQPGPWGPNGGHCRDHIMALHAMVGVDDHSILPGHGVLDAMRLAALPGAQEEGRATAIRTLESNFKRQMDHSRDSSNFSQERQQRISTFTDFFKVNGIKSKRTRWDSESGNGRNPSQQQSWTSAGGIELRQKPKEEVCVTRVGGLVEGQPGRKKIQRHRRSVGSQQFSYRRHGGSSHSLAKTRRTLKEVTPLASQPSWIETARARLKKRMFSASTSATKESKRKRIQEIMNSCDMKFIPNGLTADELLTLAAVLGESSLKSADQYVGEAKLMQLELGIPWSDVMERQLVMVKRALKRDVGPECRAKEVRPESIDTQFMERLGSTKTAPRRVVWSYLWATLWMLRATEAAEIRIQDVELKHSPRRVSLNIGKSKMDQAGKGIKRTLRCCGETPCLQLCPWSLAMRALADHVNGDGRGHSARRSGAMFYTRQGLGIHEISVLGRWKSSAVFRYIEEALEEVPLNSLILGKRPAESGRTHGEPAVHDIHRSDGGQQKPPRLGKDPLPSPRQMRDGETEVKEPTAEPETKEVMNKSGNQMWAISSRRGKRLAHSVLQASWNLDLDKWATRCGWKFAAKHVKVQLTDRLPFGITKCQKCKSQAIQRRGEAKQGVRLAQLVDLT